MIIIILLINEVNTVIIISMKLNSIKKKKVSMYLNVFTTKYLFKYS